MFLSELIVFTYLSKSIIASDVTSAAFGSDNKGLPAAFGDFDSDELTDLFVLRDNRHSVEILLGSNIEPYFRTDENLKCTFVSNQISSVVPGDFDGDALMDVLVTTNRKSKDGVIDRVTNVYVHWGAINQLNCSSENHPLIRMLDQPLAIDHNRNMTVDLFGVHENGNRTFWIFNSNRTEPESKFVQSDKPLQKLREPHSHAFIDLNDDNSPDLFLFGVNNFEVWLWNNTSNSFEFSRFIDFPENLTVDNFGQGLFVDMELADKMDLILPVCMDPLKGSGCCNNSTIYLYSQGMWYNLNTNFMDGANKQWGYPYASGTAYRDTITFHIGDYNMDGYPDVLGTLQRVGKTDTRSLFFENVPCSQGCDGYSRTFTIRWDTMTSFKNTVMGTFYDFLQDGVLDVIFVTDTPYGHNMSAYKNNLDYDANFLKVMVITGLTNNKIDLPPSVFIGNKRRTFGTNLPGPRISYKTTTQDGDPRMGRAAQLPQSAHFSMHLPYSIFGLGRTPNFVEDLTVGMFNQSHSWSQIIPNSQLVVIPNPPESADYWRAQLFVSPSKIVLQSIIALSGICFVIIVIISILHWKERREDKIEKQKESYKFPFDAM